MPIDRVDIADQLRRDITSGKWRIGDQLPSRRELAHMFGAAPNTVGEAMRILASEGLVTIRRTARSVVRSPENVAVDPNESATVVRDELTEIRTGIREVRSRLNALDEQVGGLLDELDE